MDDEKYIDESWKDAVANEKNQKAEADKNLHADSEQPSPPEDSSVDAAQMPELNFISYITSLAFQAMIFLGEIPNPLSEALEKNLTQAKFIIDTLALLKEKTAGNLTAQEADALGSFLYELQMRYVDLVQKESGGQHD